MSRNCKALFPYQAQTESELTINPNDILKIIKDDGEWWLVANSMNREGYIPSNYVEVIQGAGGGGGQPQDQTGYNNLDGLFGGGDNGSVAASSGKEICIAQHDYQAARQDELSLTNGLEIEILSKSDDGWWMGRANGHDGWFPHNFVQLKPASSQNTSAPPPYQNNDLSNINFNGASSVNSANAPLQSYNSTQPTNQINQQSQQSPGLKADVLHIVKALYPFEGQAGEISLTPDMRLEIIEKTNSEWWRARMPETGETGLIPFNYVEVTADKPAQPIMDGMFQQSASNTASLQGKDYFKGPIGRSKAEDMLKMGMTGQFLVRTSESNPQADHYSISVRGSTKMRHFTTKFENGNWKIGQKQFNSFDQLIEHYTRLPIFVDSSEKLNLTSPVR